MKAIYGGSGTHELIVYVMDEYNKQLLTLIEYWQKLGEGEHKLESVQKNTSLKWTFSTQIIPGYNNNPRLYRTNMIGREISVI